MQAVLRAVQWFTTPTGRIAAAAVVFALVWAIKNMPSVAKWLNTDRRRLAANVVLSLAPAAVMLVDQKVSAQEAWQAALTTLFGAAGLQGVLKVLFGGKAPGVGISGPDGSGGNVAGGTGTGSGGGGEPEAPPAPAVKRVALAVLVLAMAACGAEVIEAPPAPPDEMAVDAGPDGEAPPAPTGVRVGQPEGK